MNKDEDCLSPITKTEVSSSSIKTKSNTPMEDDIGMNIDQDNDQEKFKMETENSSSSTDNLKKYEDPDLANLQKVDIFLQQLPYFDKIKANGYQSFLEIKKNLFLSIVINEIRPSFIHWSNRLVIFIHEFGLFFSKKDHIELIQIYLDVMLTPNIDLPTVDICLSVLLELLKKYDKLERKDLVIKWRPIYMLYLRIHKIDDYSTELCPENLEQSSFASFIRYARIYFEPESTQEMLNEWRLMMCPFDSAMNSSLERFKLFLPTLFYENELDYGHKLWLTEFLTLWTTFNTRNFWETHLIELFARVANDTMGTIDWTPYIPYIFTNTLRGFGLPLTTKDVTSISTSSGSFNNFTQAFVYSSVDVSSLSSWIVSMIATGSNENRDVCMNHIKKMFQALRSFYYPSNTGSWSANLFLFLKSLPAMLIKRIKKEKKVEKKWYHRNIKQENLINDQDRIDFVNSLKDVVFTAIFSKSNHADARKAFQHLTFITNGEHMLLPLIEKLYESLESLVEPLRYTSILSCLILVSRELVRYNFEKNIQIQLQVIPLISAVLPGLDPNDSNKCILTLQFLSNIFSSVILFDCSPAINYRNDLTEQEKELCFETSKFEDFIHEYFKRIFYIVEYLASDISSDSSASAEAASNQFSIHGRNKSAQENVYQAHMIQSLKIIIRQSSKSYLKIILNKVKNYLSSSNTYNLRSGRILASMCSNITSSDIGEQAFELFFNYVYENLNEIKNSKSYEQILKDERGDIQVTWNLQLFSDLMKTNGCILLKHINPINQIISWYSSSINKDIINFICQANRNIIISLTTIYPLEFRSINYEISYDNEREFFEKRLPIRDWGCNGDLFKLNIKYHIPSVLELETAISFLTSSVKKSIDFLTQTFFSSSTKDNEKLSSNMREETNRELNCLNYLVYASSRLLKRPSNRKFITEHIDSNTTVGTDDNINKGLGFEKVSLMDKNHEYFNLNDENRKVLLNLRQEIIEFILNLGETISKNYTNETMSLSLISHILSTASVTYGFFVCDFEKSWKTYHKNKSTMQNKLLGKKNSLREELIQRIMLQYQFRTFYIYYRLNDIDLKIIDFLFKLSTDSIYAVVRKEAQSKLFLLMSHYPYSNQVIVPKLVALLNKSNEKALTHDQLKGSLYLLKGNSMQDSLMIKQNWNVVGEIWPALFKCQNFEKPSIQALLDKIYSTANKDHDSFDNRIKFPDDLIKKILEKDIELNNKYGKDENLRLDIFNRRCGTENKLIANLMNQLIQIAQESQLLWKNQATGFGYILFLLNSCKSEKKLLSPECVKLFVDSLVHENVNVRKIAVDALVVILKMVKYKKQTKIINIEHMIKEETNNMIKDESMISVNKSCPGYRDDNKWHLFDSEYINTITEEKWNKTHFMDKSYLGYYCWPKKIEVTLNTREFYCIESIQNNTNKKEDDFSDALRPIIEKFQDIEFVKKFIRLFTIEESKGNEKFDKKRFYFFKALFRNFGTSLIIKDLFTHLTGLINDKQSLTQECSHKLASEIVSGLMRGSKYWNFKDLKFLWSKLNNILDQIVENITTDNLSLWFSCFSNSFEDQDPRRCTFYLNYFIELAYRIFKIDDKMPSISPASTSFQQSSCLQLLLAFNQFEWRIPDFWSKLFDIFLANMDHPYKTIREKVGSCISLCLTNEVNYSIAINKLSNKLKSEEDRTDNLIKFINFIEVKLNNGIELFDTLNADNIDNMKESKTEKELSAVNFLQTTFSWLGNYFIKSYQPINKETIRIIPQLCSIDKIASQDVLVKQTLPLIRNVFSMWMLDEQIALLFLNQLNNVLEYKSWHSRFAAIQMLQNFGIFNLFLLDSEIKNKIKQSIINSLVDEQLEVRMLASIAFTGFIHSKLIEVDENLINQLKALSKFKPKSKDKETGKVTIDMPNLIKRHGGVLGLCSIINSCPYDVPSYLPDILTYICQFTNDPVLVQTTVKKCLSEFRRTHHDNWKEHKLSFNENQIAILADILISPNYYA